MTFTYQDEIVYAGLSSKFQRIHISKTSINTVPIKAAASLWPGTGQPTTGSYGTLGLSNGRVCNQSTSGSINFTTASAGKSQYLLFSAMSGISSTNVLGSYSILDRISDVLVSHSSSTGTITGLDATSRLGAVTGSGDGAQILIETQTNFSAASNTFRIQYTNQNGLTGRITPAFTTVSSSVVGSIPTQQLFIPLQSGDTGARSIQAITQSAGTATGQMAICLVKQIIDVPMSQIGTIVCRDMISDFQFCPPIKDDACLMIIFYATAASTENLIIDLTIAEI